MEDKSIVKAEEALEMEDIKDAILGQDSKVTPDNMENSEGKKEPGEVDWSALAAEFAWKNIWTERDWKSIGKHFLFAFSFGFFFSAFDVFTDGWSGFTFIFGTDYIKNVESPNDTSVADSESCKNISQIVVVAEDGTESVKYYQYQCFEKDPIWGAVTLAFMFTPGLWGGKIWGGLDKQVNWCLHTTLCILSPPFFPLIVIGTKLLGLVNPGPEMRKLLTRVNMIEGRGESTMQFGLQLFILMSREDRMPSSLQWATIFASFLMLNKTGIECYLRFDEPSPDRVTKYHRNLTKHLFEYIHNSLNFWCKIYSRIL